MSKQQGRDQENANGLPVWCAGDEWCPITTTATLVGKKWHPVIVHRLLEHGPLGFNALKEAVDGISSKVLSDSLSDMEETTRSRPGNDLPGRSALTATDSPWRDRYGQSLA